MWGFSTITDRAFVRFFLAMATNGDASGLTALNEFAGLYLKSDWGRYVPFTKPLFLYGLLSLAQEFHPGMLPATAGDSLLGETWAGLWKRYEERLPELRDTAAGFTGELAFLNVE